jgi:hypothetical protein
MASVVYVCLRQLIIYTEDKPYIFLNYWEMSVNFYLSSKRLFTEKMDHVS